MTFQDFFACIFQESPGPFTSIFHVFPGLFNRVDIRKSHFYIHLANQLLRACKAKVFQQFSTNNCKYPEYVVNVV